MGSLTPPPAAPGLAFVTRLSVAVDRPIEVGEMGAGERRVIAITGGTAEGERLSGRVLAGGADFQVIRPSGLTELHARYVIETQDGARIYVENSGLRFGPADALDRLRRGESVDPALIYFCSAPRFEASAPAYRWLTQRLFVATGIRRPDRVELAVFEVT
jgi:Protein of unknown function (DUF3237)